MHITPELHVGRGMRFVQSCQTPQGGHWKSQGVSTSKGWRCAPWYLSSNRPRHASYSFWSFFLCLQSIPGLYVLHLPLILLQWAVTYNSLFSSIFNGTLWNFGQRKRMNIDTISKDIPKPPMFDDGMLEDIADMAEGCKGPGRQGQRCINVAAIANPKFWT